MADVNNDAALKDKQESKLDTDESVTKDKVEKSLDSSDEAEPEDSDFKEKKSDDPSKDEKADEEDEGESEEEEELPPGLLEQPLELEGKREKKKVDRLAATIVQPKEKKKVEIEEGKGVKLGDIDFIESRLNATKAADLKPLHRLLFLRIGAANDVKKNIRQFCGFTHSVDSKEHEKRVAILDKMFMPQLKSICLVLALERSGAKKDVVERIMDFLMNPVDKGKKVPQKKRRSKSSDGNKGEKKGKKRKRSSAKKAKSKKKVDGDDDDEDEEDDGEDAGSLDEEEIEDMDDEADDKDISEEEIEEVESEEEAPKKKKAKVEPKKKEADVNGKKEKSTPKPKPKKKEQKKESPKKKKVDEIDDSLSEDSDSDDEPIAKMIKSPPSNEEIKKLVKNILEGADLEAVTMKTVVKEVYSKYPTFDLSDRKDFIKSTVREIIS